MLTKLLNISAFAAGAGATIYYLHPQFRPYFRTVDVKQRTELFTEVERVKVPGKDSVFYDCYTKFLSHYHAYAHNTFFDKMDETQLIDTSTIKIFKFNEYFTLKQSDGKLQNILLAMIDSQMGYTAALYFGKKPTVTAHIDYNYYKPLDTDQRYISHGFIEKREGNNVWIRVVVLDQEGEKVASFGSRFVKLNLALI